MLPVRVLEQGVDMFEPIRIAPSILSADFMNFERDVKCIEEGGAGFVHVDVMDGHFVPNLTMGVPVVRQLKRVTGLPLDVHLMISNPLVQIPWYTAAGADYISVHAEVLYGPALDEAIDLIHEGGAKASIALKPKTPVEVLEPVIAKLDMVLIMSVEPGFSGQSYIEGSDERVAQVVEMSRRYGVAPLIELDGGIGVKTAPLVASAGGDVFVCGNAVCAAADPARAIQEILEVSEEARQSALASKEA